MTSTSKVDLIINRMRSSGLKVTPSRVRVVEALARAKGPLSADDIYDMLKGKVNRVTVYRTLDALEQADCISRLSLHNSHEYELVGEHAHYLVCRNCERVERVPCCTVSGVEESSLKASRHFASLDRHTLQLTGLCNACMS